MGTHFRFEDLEIGQLARAHAVRFHALIGTLDGKKRYGYAEKVRPAGLSLANKIAEGSSSAYVGVFQRLLSVARNSAVEGASMLIVFESMGLVAAAEVDVPVADRDFLSCKLAAFYLTLSPT